MKPLPTQKAVPTMSTQIPHKATITVAHIHPPEAGKKMGKVVATDGQVYWCWPGELGRYAEGETFEIGYKLGGNQGTLRSLVGFPKEAANNGSAPPPQNASENYANGAATGNWEKLTLTLMLDHGLNEEAAIQTGIQIRRIARKILQTDIDGKLPKEGEPFNDSLDDTF